MAETKFVWRWRESTPWHHCADLAHCKIELKKPRERSLRDRPWSIVIFGDQFSVHEEHMDIEDAKRAAERIATLRIKQMAKAVGIR